MKICKHPCYFDSIGKKDQNMFLFPRYLMNLLRSSSGLRHCCVDVVDNVNARTIFLFLQDLDMDPDHMIFEDDDDKTKIEKLTQQVQKVPHSLSNSQKILSTYRGNRNFQFFLLK